MPNKRSVLVLPISADLLCCGVVLSNILKNMNDLEHVSTLMECTYHLYPSHLLVRNKDPRMILEQWKPLKP